MQLILFQINLADYYNLIRHKAQLCPNAFLNLNGFGKGEEAGWKVAHILYRQVVYILGKQFAHIHMHYWHIAQR